uniref:Macro domain-containing protein n=1 Tax=Ascaris lumbricoides TaxID=6252 RepID=A0A0M3HZS5_ASCLU
MCGIVLSLMRRQAFCDELLLPTKFCCITSGSHRECQIAIFTNAVVVGVDGEVDRGDPSNYSLHLLRQVERLLRQQLEYASRPKRVMLILAIPPR